MHMIMAAALVAVAAPACTPQPSVAERCASAKDPAECVKVADAGGDVSDYLLYGMAGYMLSSAINGSGQRQTVIVSDPNYHGYRRPIPSYAASRERFARSRTTTTTTKRSLFGGTKTVTRTSTWSSRPSFRSSYRSSSFRSSRR